MFKRFKDGEKRAAKEIYEYLQLTGSKIKTLAHIRRNYEVGNDNLPKNKKKER